MQMPFNPWCAHVARIVHEIGGYGADTHVFTTDTCGYKVDTGGYKMNTLI
jgi:hypothetical protein